MPLCNTCIVKRLLTFAYKISIRLDRIKLVIVAHFERRKLERKKERKKDKGMETEIVLCCFWLTSAIVYSVKPFVPILDTLLSYGKHQHQHHGGKHLCFFQIQKALTLVDLSLDPAVAWCTFYVTGLTMSFIAPLLMDKAEPSLAITLFRTQCIRRFLECVFIQHFSAHRRTPLLHTLCGITYYTAVAFTMTVHTPQRTYEQSFYHQLFVIVLFAISSTVQFCAHASLANAPPHVGKYGLPTSKLFAYVLCPHYTAEILIYICFALQLQTISSACMLLFVIVNLTTTAHQTAKWYIKTFPSNQLPQTRYKVIPYVL